MKRIWRSYYDLLLAGALAFSLPLLPLLPLAPLRVALGLVAALFAPGYVLTELAFARRDSLRDVERLGMSFGLSVAVLPLLAIVLDVLPWGIKPLPIMICLLIWIVGMGLLAALRRSSLVRAEQAALPPAPRRPSRRAVAAALGLAGGAALLIAVLPALFQPGSARLTEFYLLGAAGLAEDFPREVGQSQPFTVTVGLANREGAAQTYRLEARSQGRVVGALGAFELAAGLEREQPLTLTLPLAGADQKIEIELFRQADAAPYRRLELWLDVLPAKAP